MHVPRFMSQGMNRNFKEKELVGFWACVNTLELQKAHIVKNTRSLQVKVHLRSFISKPKSSWEEGAGVPWKQGSVQLGS